MQQKIDYRNRKNKGMSVWQLLILDLILAGVGLCIFYLFLYVLPSVSSTKGIDIIADEDTKPTFNLPSKVTPLPYITTTPIPGKTPSLSNTITPAPTSTPIPYNYAKKYGSSPFDRNVSLLNTYYNENSEIYINRVEIGDGNAKITYYIADVFVTGIQEVQTAFAKGQYGKNLSEDILEIAENNNAMLAISGDFYSNNDVGVVIRNGVFYRSEVTNQDICVMYIDGTIRTYSPEEFDIDEVLANGAWQAWTFGPALLDNKGNILDTFNCSSYIKKSHPRCSIGYVTPGHYVMLVVDGREEGYSDGVDLTELAQIMIDEGCVSAYNLDGGKTAAMVFNGMTVNRPAGGGRNIGDIVFISR